MIAVCQHLSTRVVAVVSSLVVLFDGRVGANYQPRHNSEIATQSSLPKSSYRVYTFSLIKRLSLTSLCVVNLIKRSIFCCSTNQRLLGMCANLTPIPASSV